jgi:hypothetical protein
MQRGHTASFKKSNHSLEPLMNMKSILIPLLCLGVSLPVWAQTNVSQTNYTMVAPPDDEYKHQQRLALSLASRLFPDSAVPSSEMGKKMQELDDVLKQNHSVLYVYASKQLILSFEAAGILRATAHWENLSSQQILMTIDYLNYALLCTKDFEKPRAPSATTDVPGGATGPQGAPSSDGLGEFIFTPQNQTNDTHDEKDGTKNK